MRYRATSGTIIDQSKMHPLLKRNVEVFSACDWLAALTAHIPNAGEHLVRYYESLIFPLTPPSGASDTPP